MELSAHELISGAITVVAGVLSYLARHFLQSIERDQKLVLSAVGKIEGKIEALTEEIRRSTLSQAKTQAELKAIWRFIDGAHLRATDNGNNHDES